jgi:hypothetical protein
MCNTTTCTSTGARARTREVQEAEVIVGGERSDDSDAELEVLYPIYAFTTIVYT